MRSNMTWWANWRIERGPKLTLWWIPSRETPTSPLSLLKTYATPFSHINHSRKHTQRFPTPTISLFFLLQCLYFPFSSFHHLLHFKMALSIAPRGFLSPIHPFVKEATIHTVFSQSTFHAFHSNIKNKWKLIRFECEASWKWSNYKKY